MIIVDAYLPQMKNERRGIKWSLRVFSSMRSVCLFLRARAVVKFFSRAASTLKNTDGEQRALRVYRKFSE